MLQTVLLKKKELEDYIPFIGEAEAEKIRELARPLKGLRVLHVNATAYGGGVAELLTSTLPLLNDVGLEASWALLCKEEPFFDVTKALHNALQGKAFELNAQARDTYLRRNEGCAKMLDAEYDVIVVHDPQPAALRHFRGKGGARWIWRCHIDTSAPDTTAWSFLRPFVEEHDAAIFTMEAFVPPDLRTPRVMIAPAIDPFTSKNLDLPISACRTIVKEFGLDLRRPILLQVSRFDPWKDPLGVLEVYRRVKEKVPGLQLAFIGGMADDDPEGWRIYEQVKEKAQAHRDIFLYTNLTGVHAFEVNCFQRVADVVIQKSIREGFGLVVSEALWKRAAVVAGNVGGIPMQIQDGKSGFLAGPVEQFAERITRLLGDENLRKEFGEKGREAVRSRFLVTRLVREELELYAKLSGARNAVGASKGGRP